MEGTEAKTCSIDISGYILAVVRHTTDHVAATPAHIVTELSMRSVIDELDCSLSLSLCAFSLCSRRSSISKFMVEDKFEFVTSGSTVS